MTMRDVIRKVVEKEKFKNGYGIKNRPGGKHEKKGDEADSEDPETEDS